MLLYTIEAFLPFLQIFYGEFCEHRKLNDNGPANDVHKALLVRVT